MPDLTPLEAAEIIENGDCGQHRYDADSIAAFYLREIVAGEYAPVVHGRWLNFYNGFSTAVCSECGEMYEVSPDEKSCAEFFDAFRQLYKFCPSCGALMDGKEDTK